MDEKITEFVNLIDDALRLAEERLHMNLARGKPKDEPRGVLENIIYALRLQRDEVLSGKLEPSKGYVTLGLSREVLDWDDWGSPLAKAVGKVERYYQEVYR
jgi:hypothetical protein